MSIEGPYGVHMCDCTLVCVDIGGIVLKTRNDRAFSWKASGSFGFRVGTERILFHSACVSTTC